MEKPVNKKEAIYSAMLRLISTQGIHATPMSQVAKEAGVAAGTIYTYFKSKDALLNELYIHLKKKFGEALTQGTDSSMTYREQFFYKWEALYNYFISNPLSFVFAEHVVNSPVISQEARGEGEKYYQPVIAFFGLGQESGVLREMNLEVLTTLVYGNVVSAVSLQLSGKLLITDEMLKQIISSSWDSVVKNKN